MQANVYTLQELRRSLEENSKYLNLERKRIKQNQSTTLAFILIKDSRQHQSRQSAADVSNKYQAADGRQQAEDSRHQTAGSRKAADRQQ